MVFEAVLAPLDHQILLKVNPPPEKVIAVFDVSVSLIVEVFALNVRLVVVAVNHVVVVAPVKVQVPLPIVTVLILELEDTKEIAVRLKLFALKVPLVNVTVREEPTVKASPNCQVPPTPSKVIGTLNVTPLLVIVFVPEVALKFSATVELAIVIPEAMV